MNKLLLPILSLALSVPAISQESPFSISVGQKTMHTDMKGFTTNGLILEGVTASSNAIYTSISYNQTPSLSYAFEYASFIGSNAAEAVYQTLRYDGTTFQDETSEYKVKVEPSNYFSLHAHYAFRVDKTVRPYLFAGLSYISADIEHENFASKNGVTTKNERFVESDTSIGVLYGAGLDIQIYQNFSFIFDYRIQQDIADQPVDEMSGAFKYRF